MSKKNKNSFGVYLLMFLLIIFFILFYVGMKLQVDSMKKEIIVMNENINILKSEQLSLIAQNQLLTNEERIKEIAENELGLISNSSLLTTIRIQKNRIKKIEETFSKGFDFQN
jgi:cell division protein FtsL